MIPNELEIASDGYRASVKFLGGGLSKLRYNNRPLVEEESTIPRFFGELLSPWPNRIRDGKYSFEGKNFSLPINEIRRNNSLHGFFYKLKWELVTQSKNKVSLAATLIQDSSSYPTSLRMLVTYSLSSEGLQWTLSTKNSGKTVAPYGASIHPYLIADPMVGISGCTLFMDSSFYIEVDPIRLLPIQVRHVSHADFDFRGRSLIGERKIDHAFKLNSNLINNRIEFIAPSRKGVWISSDNSAKWVQVHTADREGGSDSRNSLAVEPMTCPPDSFNSQEDLIELHPGDTHQMNWWIGAI
jgi:aldose 1-epimerase